MKISAVFIWELFKIVQQQISQKKREFLSAPPLTVDWREAGIITPVKD